MRWLLVALALTTGCGYNTIQTYDEQVNAAEGQIKVQLQRRADLIPNIVETVKGYAKQEMTIFTEVAEARAKLAGAVQSNNVEQMAAANAALTAPFGRLLAIAENYPQLKSNENVKMLQEELSGTENKIGFARQFYNDIATKYNIARETFPSNLIAGSFGFTPAELFEIKDDAERAVPSVDLSFGKK
jgi:LemA protein